MGGFFGGGASVDLASPSAIGSTTPNTGAFTTLSANNGTITTSSPAFTLAQTWNAGAVAFTALMVNATDTASATATKLIDLQVAASTKFQVRKDGVAYASSWITSPNGFRVSSFTDSSFQLVQINAGGAVFPSGASFSWTNASSGPGTADLILLRDAANILAQRNSTNAQTFRLYRTYTDASNYERLGFIATRTTRFAIAAENAGTGAARSLEISFYTSASDPTSTDITDGCFSVWKNSGTGTIKLWANDGGTMKSVALA